MAVLRELLARFNLQVNDREVTKADKKMLDFGSTIQKVGALIGVGLFVRGAKRFVSETIAMGDSIDKVSSKLGLAADSLQEYRFAAQLAGVPQTALDMGLQRFIRRTAEAAAGTGEAKDILKQYKIQLKDTDGALKSSEAVLNQVADTIMGVTDEQERLRIAFKLFDSEGVALVNMLKEGSGGLEAMRMEARRLGGVMSQDLVKQSVEATDNITRLEFGLRGIRNIIALQVLPTVNRWITSITKAIQTFQKMGKLIGSIKRLLLIFSAVLGGIAITLTLLFAPVLIPLTAIAAAVTVVVLLMEDFITMLQGGESVIGNFVWQTDQLLEKLEGLVPGLETLRDIGQFLGGAFADKLLGVGAENFDREFARVQAAAKAQDTKRKRARGPGTAVVRKGEFGVVPGAREEFLRGDAINLVRERAIAKTMRGGLPAQTTQNLNANVTVNANGTDPKAVMEIVKRERRKLVEGMLKDAAAAQAGSP